jgi:hypothetical protein
MSDLTTKREKGQPDFRAAAFGAGLFFAQLSIPARE